MNERSVSFLSRVQFGQILDPKQATLQTTHRHMHNTQTHSQYTWMHALVDDGTGEAAAFAKSVDIPVLAAIPQDDDLRKKSANYQIVGTNESQWGSLFSALADAVAIEVKAAQAADSGAATRGTVAGEAAVDKATAAAAAAATQAAAREVS